MTERIEFLDRYRVGIAAIDNQHEHIFSLFNHLGDSVDRGEVAICWSLIDELRDALKWHFREEELILERKGFVGLDNHRLHHASFLERMNINVIDLYDKSSPADAASCYTMILNSFLDDILDADLHIFHSLATPCEA